MVSEATFTLNSLYPEQSVGFPIQTAFALACFVLPLLGFFLQVLFGKRLWRKGDWLPTGAMGLAFLCALAVCYLQLGKFDPNYAVEWRFNWMDIRGDGHDVAQTETNLAKLHLGEALIGTGYLDAHGKPTRQLQLVDDATQVTTKFEAAEGKLPEVKLASDSYLAGLLPWFAMTDEQAGRHEAEPYVFFRKRVLDFLHDSDGAKRGKQHADFDAWYRPTAIPESDKTFTERRFNADALAADAAFARKVLESWTADPKNARQLNVNNQDVLKNAFTIGIYVDNFTAITLFMVTLLSFLIHLFSTGYMQGEVRYARFFATINLFTVGMIGLVIANNFLWLFVCWEIMGLCSYLLIGHYFEKPSAQAACVKAFITTRIGDVFMFIGMMLIFFHSKTLLFTGPNEFQTLFKGWQQGALDGAMTWGLTTYGGPGSFFAVMGSQAALIGGAGMTVIGLLLFIGPVGKSAQFPLHVWLPDAMEGPTPVSAMIHAACMVSAGVYLTARLFPIFTPDTLTVIAFVGGFTALFAGTIGLVQTDIKKVLAYSTISQLGYMFLGIGCGAWVPAVFHMLTHAFFKALMFLGSGSVILGCHHEQEMTRMGGLWRKMPVTAATFWIGNLAITGAPFFFSGFYSKEAVLTQANIFGMENGGVLWLPYVFGALGAGLTTFYMFRLVWMTFHGRPRDKWVYEHAKESPWNVVLPLIIIAGFAAVIGWPLMAKGDIASNLKFTNVVEFGLIAFAGIVLGLTAALYLFRRRDEKIVKSPWLRRLSWATVIGLPLLFVAYVPAAYFGAAPMTTNAGPEHEQHARIEGGKRVYIKQVDPHGPAAVAGRPGADGQSWFYYLVTKPRTCFTQDFLLNEARFDEKKVATLFLGEDGHGLFADSKGVLPSDAWGERYNKWRKSEGLPLDPRFGAPVEGDNDAHKAGAHASRNFNRPAYVSAGPVTIQHGHDDHHSAPKADEHSSEGAGHGDGHGHAASGHGDHAHDDVTHQWHEKHHAAHVKVFGISMVAFLIGLALSMFFFSPWGPFYLKEWIGHVGFKHWLRTLLKRGYFLDNLYYGTVVKCQAYIMRICAWFDKYIVDGLVNVIGKVNLWLGFTVAKIDYWGVDGTVRGVSNATLLAGRASNKAPTGKISDYVFMLIAAIVILFIALALLS